MMLKRVCPSEWSAKHWPCEPTPAVRPKTNLSSPPAVWLGCPDKSMRFTIAFSRTGASTEGQCPPAQLLLGTGSFGQFCKSPDMPNDGSDELFLGMTTKLVFIVWLFCQLPRKDCNA